jgi:hypothetical protein
MNAPLPLYNLGMVAIRMADEGIPIQAIARVMKVPSEDFRHVLKDAVSAGRLVELPAEDWPPATPRALRTPTRKAPRPANDNRPGEDDEILILHLSKLFRTTRLQSTVLLRLMRRSICTKQMIHDAVEDNRGNPDEPTSEKIVDVVVCHIRKKLKPFGLALRTLHGQGYHMPPEDQYRASEMLREETANATRSYQISCGAADARSTVEPGGVHHGREGAKAA